MLHNELQAVRAPIARVASRRRDIGHSRKRAPEEDAQGDHVARDGVQYPVRGERPARDARDGSLPAAPARAQTRSGFARRREGRCCSGNVVERARTNQKSGGSMVESLAHGVANGTSAHEGGTLMNLTVTSAPPCTNLSPVNEVGAMAMTPASDSSQVALSLALFTPRLKRKVGSP